MRLDGEHAHLVVSSTLYPNRAYEAPCKSRQIYQQRSHGGVGCSSSDSIQDSIQAVMHKQKRFRNLFCFPHLDMVFKMYPTFARRVGLPCVAYCERSCRCRIRLSSHRPTTSRQGLSKATTAQTLTQCCHRRNQCQPRWSMRMRSGCRRSCRLIRSGLYVTMATSVKSTRHQRLRGRPMETPETFVDG